MQKLLSLAVVGLVASSAANAESKTSFSVISTSTDYSYSTAKIAVDMTGFAIGTTIDIDEQFFLTGAYSALSGTASLGLSGTTIATGNVDQDTLTLGAGINLTNDLDRQAGTGGNLKAALAYSKTDIGTLSANNTLIGLKYDFALAKKVSINTTFSGVIDDFNPAYGVGISYSLRGGDLFAGYAFTEDNVAGIKIEDSALNVGYSFNF